MERYCQISKVLFCRLPGGFSFAVVFIAHSSMDVFFSPYRGFLFVWFRALRLYGAGFFKDTALLVGWSTQMFASLVEKIAWQI